MMLVLKSTDALEDLTLPHVDADSFQPWLIFFNLFLESHGTCGLTNFEVSLREPIQIYVTSQLFTKGNIRCCPVERDKKFRLLQYHCTWSGDYLSPNLPYSLHCIPALSVSLAHSVE